MVEGLEWGLGFMKLCHTLGREREAPGVCFGKQEERKHVDKSKRKHLFRRVLRYRWERLSISLKVTTL